MEINPLCPVILFDSQVPNTFWEIKTQWQYERWPRSWIKSNKSIQWQSYDHDFLGPLLFKGISTCSLLHEVLHRTQWVLDATYMTQSYKVTFVLISAPLVMVWHPHLYAMLIPSHAFQKSEYVSEWTKKWHFHKATFAAIVVIEVKNPGFATRLQEMTSQCHGVVACALNPGLRNIMNSSSFENKP